MLHRSVDKEVLCVKVHRRRLKSARPGEETKKSFTNMNTLILQCASGV